MSIHAQKVSFNSGELDPLMDARVNVEKYESGCRRLENFIIQPHGPASRRPGLEFLGRQGDDEVASRFIEFNFSATTRFMIEMTTGEFRFWSNGVLVPVTGSVSHPYEADELFQVQVKQVNDVCYMCHPNHHPLKLSRFGDTNWQCITLPLRYPPLLDEYVEKESVATPTVTTKLEQPMREAEQFTVTAAAVSTVPTLTVEPNGSNQWFTLNWTWSGPADTSGKTCAMEVLRSDGGWVRFGTGAVTLSTTTTAPVPTERRFVASGRNLIMYTRNVGASTWGTGVTIINFYPNGFTGAATALTMRLVVGTETTSSRSDHVCHVTPWSGTALAVPMVPVLTAPASANMTATWTLPGTVTAGQTMTWQVLTAGTWTTMYAQPLAVALAPQTLRLRYTTPVTTTPVTLALELRNAVTGVWSTLGAAVTLPAVVTSWAMRLVYGPTTSKGLAGNVTLSDGATHVAKLEQMLSAVGDAGNGGVTMPIGKWQVRLDVGAVAVPSGARATLQRWAGPGWVTHASPWSLVANKSFRYDGTTTGELKTTQLFRVLYSPGVTGVDLAADAIFESVVYPASDAIRVSVNNTSGNARTMTATSAIFQAGHVGAFWQIAHRRDLSFTEIVGVVGVFPAEKWVSAALRIVGSYDVYTYGTWNGKLYLERKTASNAWEILRVWTSNNDRNVQVNASSDVDSDYRLRLESGVTGTAASGAAVPRFLLEAADARTYGLVRVVQVTSPTVAVVDIVRALASEDETTLWAEGAWSDVRGFPAALALHEQRIWFGGTKYQPQTLWASVSGDFENFRRSTSDDGSIALTLAAEASNSVRWISSAPGALLVGTGGDEWAVKAKQDGPITSLSAKAEVQSSYSSATLPARRANDVTLFIQRDGRRIRQMAYAQGQEGFVASDLTVLASHITRGGIRQMAFQQAPQAIIWAVTELGQLVGMTFEKDQNVFGWHRHFTDGFVESIAILHGTPSDEVWCAVRRTISGETVRTVERMIMRESYSGHSRLIYLDGALLSKTVGARATVTGLEHLEGRTVTAMVNGALAGVHVVTSGAIDLDVPAGEPCVVGLPYCSLLQPMKQEMQLQDGTAQGRKFKLNDATVRVHESLGGEMSADAGDERLPWSRLQLEAAQDNDSLPVLLTRDVRVKLESRHQAAVNAAIRTSSPFPLTVTALTLNYDVYGD